MGLLLDSVDALPPSVMDGGHSLVAAGQRYRETMKSRPNKTVPAPLVAGLGLFTGEAGERTGVGEWRPPFFACERCFVDGPQVK